MELSRRETCLLAHSYNPYKHRFLNLKHWFLSIKLDGFRMMWDGGVSWGLPCSEIPFANTTKHHIRKCETMATGCWTRLLQPIAAPIWFLESLPVNVPLDGELYSGLNSFQQIMSTCKRYLPIDEDWKTIKYHVFDSFTLPNFLQEGRINVPLFTKEIGPECLEWAIERMKENLPARRPHVYRFAEVYDYLKKEFVDHPNIRVVEQTKLGDRNLEHLLEELTEQGHEGAMLRNPNSYWIPRRSNDLLKVKPEMNGIGKLIGFKFGERTDRGSKLLGMVGALTIEWNGKRFYLGGLNDHERELNPEHKKYAIDHPGEYAPQQMEPLRFKIGQAIKFSYNSLSDIGIPKFARYSRS